MATTSIILTDTERGIWLDSFDLGADSVGPGVVLRKRTLQGGPRHGIDVIEASNGAFAFTVLPTRGMGLWRAQYRDVPFGWASPVRGPVHPQFVNLSAQNGLGWLTGFDELLCRCGLAWAGPPGDDNGFALSLHGRIANTPAYKVELRTNRESGTFSVIGHCEEAGLFYPRLRLSTAYVTTVGSNKLTVTDEVTNLGGQPTELQMLYHVNLGPPLLGEGSKVRLALNALVPQTPHAAAAVDSWDTYAAPTPGFLEQVYLCEPKPGADGQTLAVLHDSAAEKALALRWPVTDLPCFTLWKNTAATEDGYVTGLEPATCYPNFKAKERAAGRVRILQPGEKWRATWTLEGFADAAGVAGVCQEVAAIQSGSKPRIERVAPE